MRVIRVYNNNVVATKTDDKEAIVQGSGIGFGKNQVILLMKKRLKRYISSKMIN